MLKLPGNLTPESFLEQYWQKQPLLMPGALAQVRPAITRNELGWLATLDDVESRLVFVDRQGTQTRYRAEAGPFTFEYLEQLPKRDWTLLVHDVEKHLPAMRALFRHVPFIPDWRVDDLMVSFAAPGGGVGPHLDNYDVFLCQGIGVRQWRYSRDEIVECPEASDDLALLSEFDGEAVHDTTQGDVLYLPPGVAHWGTSKRACITYSIGMRAPAASDILFESGGSAADAEKFYEDPDLTAPESKPGYISNESVHRAVRILGDQAIPHHRIGQALGKLTTITKDWLKPDGATQDETHNALEYLNNGGRLLVHGMALVAFDDESLYVNGARFTMPDNSATLLGNLCEKRSIRGTASLDAGHAEMVRWMLQHGAFEIPENS
jgi:50S ribosomal protein L16 3-hydroxylase